MSEKKHIGSFVNQPKNSPKGNNYLLAIAIDDYEHAPNLSNCVKDAKGFIEILTDKYNFDYQKDGQKLIYSLFNEQATRKNILRTLKVLKDKITPADNFVIYYSGHGEKENDTGFWVPVEAKPNEEDEFVSTHDITHRLDAIKSFHTFLIADACFAGSLFVAHKNVKSGYESKPSRWGLAASHSREVALDGRPGENSPFADRLLRILRENHSSISIQKLCSELIEEVSRITKNAQVPVFQPLNVKGHELGQYIFHLKKDEAGDWATTSEKNTIAAYQLYITQYPNGRFMVEAESKIKELKASALWQRIQESKEEDVRQISQKIRLIEQFILDFEDAKEYVTALDKGEYLEMKKEFFRAKNSKFALLKFVKNDTPFKEEAEQILQDWEPEIEPERPVSPPPKTPQKIIEVPKEKPPSTVRDKKKPEKRIPLPPKTAPKTVGVSNKKLPFIEQKAVRYIAAIIFLIFGIFFIYKMTGVRTDTTDGNILQKENSIEEKSEPQRILLSPILSGLEKNMVTIPSGSFTMGCTKEQGSDCRSNEKPPHDVTISSFKMNKYEVTQEEWRAVMGKDPPELQFKGCDKCPVENVSWNDIQEFLKKINKITGNKFRLPTEAEWEYAARGGEKFKFSGSKNLNEVGWYNSNSGNKTHPVGQKNKNGFGLYDMSGNVIEWCKDTWHPDYIGAPNNESEWEMVGISAHVLRGGCFRYTAATSRVSFRNNQGAHIREDVLGFRLAHSL